MNEKKFWNLLYFLFFVLAVTVSLLVCRERSGLLTNIVFAVVMYLMILAGCCGFFSHRAGLNTLYNAAGELQRAADRIEKAAEDPEQNLDELLDADGETCLFRNHWLKEAFAQHRSDLNRLYREDSDFRCADLAEYINQELLDLIGNVSFNNLISGSMTGLGILGTFVGLMLGLQDFNTSTADGMMQTIPPLIDGIKVAFITSIFGVVFSLLFSIFFRRVISGGACAADEFLKTYYKYVLAKPDNDGFTQLLRYQKKQSDNMSQLAENISVSMASALGESVVPTFEKIESSIGSLTEKMAQHQSQSIEKISEEFVRKMDESMGNQMHHLGENIQMLLKWQDDTMEKMGQAVTMFAESAGHLDTLDSSFSDSVQAMDQYIKNMDGMQNHLLTAFDQAEEHASGVLSEMQKRLEEASGLFESQQKLSEELARKQQEHAARLLQTQQDQAAQLLQAQQENAAQLLKDQQSAGAELIRIQQEAAQDLAETQQQMVASQQELVKAQQEAGAELSRIQEELLKGQQENSAQLVRVQQEAGAELTSTQQELIKAQQQLVTVQQQAVDQVLTAEQNAVDRIQRAETMLAGQQQETAGQMEKAAAAMNDASQELSANLSKSMTHTYQEIDKQLAEIVRHLSGTLADMRTVTEAVPKMMLQASEQSRKTMQQASEQSQKTLSGYLKSISEAQKNMDEEIKSVHNEMKSAAKEHQAR